MLNIGICDSDSSFIEQLYNSLDECMKFLHSDWNVSRFLNVRDFQSAVKTGAFQGTLLFADPSLKDESDNSLATYINQFCPQIDAIFVTSTPDLVFDYSPSNIYGWLSKPLDPNQLQRLLSQYMNQRPIDCHCLNITINADNYSIPLHSIRYIESHKRQVIVHTANQDYEYYQTLQQLEQDLAPHGFLRCHKSYLVPISGITRYTATTLYLGTVTIPIGRAYKDQVKQQTDAALPTGALICMQGIYAGAITHLCANQTIVIGRDGECADFVLNFPQISRIHCELLYDAQKRQYQITDYSTNGTFTDKGNRLAKGEPYLLKPGSKLYFADRQLIYQLG